MDAIQRMGVAYGKLGLATDPHILDARIAGVKAVAAKLRLPQVPELLRHIFGLKVPSEQNFLISEMSSLDPTFGVKAGDREIALLANTVAALEMEASSGIHGEIALSLLAAAAGGIRQPVTDAELLQIAEATLTVVQTSPVIDVPDRKYNKQPKTILDTLKALTDAGNGAYSTSHAHIVSLLTELGKYAESNALAAAKSDNEIIGYITRLEEEMRIYWWVTGGWCADANVAFSSLGLFEAAIRAGKELAGRHSSTVGLFAAPALISLVLERGRADSQGMKSINEAATSVAIPWRKLQFEGIASGSLADLLPLSAAMGLAAESDDAEDWRPRFKRITGIDADSELRVREVGVQVYREQLAYRALGG